MTTCRAAWLLMLLPMLVGFASSAAEVSPTNSPAPVTVIKYCSEPFCTFEIVGTDRKGISKLSELTAALRKHKQQVPGARYEVLAEVKSTPDGEKAIVQAIHEAGIRLEHYWSAHSALAPTAEVGPHGPGYVDHIGRYEKTR